MGYPIEGLGLSNQASFASIDLEATPFATGAGFSLWIQNRMADFANQEVLAPVDLPLIHIGTMNTVSDMEDDKVMVIFVILAIKSLGQGQAMRLIIKINWQAKGLGQLFQIEILPMLIVGLNIGTQVEVHMPR